MTERKGNTPTHPSDADLEPQPKTKGNVVSTRSQLPLRQASGAATDGVAVPHTPVDEDEKHERGTAPASFPETHYPKGTKSTRAN